MKTSALYANKFNTLFLDDLNNPEKFGFAKNQVTPFNIQTPDGETLYAWHILPLDVYSRHEHTLRKEERPHAPVRDFTKTTAFKLLTSKDLAPAKVVVACMYCPILLLLQIRLLTVDRCKVHGNAGHIAQGWRPDTYRYMTTESNTHVVAIDYRGFGHSTGSPTEAGLITDGTALVNWVLKVGGISPDRIVLLGQSLGTAVASAVGLRFADPNNPLLPPPSPESEKSVLSTDHGSVTTTFAGIVLVAPFSSIPSLLLTYRLGGWIPLLFPLKPFPQLAKALTSRMVDKWETAERLTAYYRVLAGSSQLHEGSRNMATLQLVHALNDAEISYHQTEIICQRMLNKRDDQGQLGSGECIDGSNGPAIVDVKRDGWPRLRFQLVEAGGKENLAPRTKPISYIDIEFHRTQ